MATIVRSRIAVRESSHISFFCGGDSFLWSSALAREHTGGADRSAWVTSGFLPSLERPVDLSLLLKWPAGLSKRISASDQN